jgi:hypothetical protein
MLGQLPGPREVFLDHVAHFVPAMSSAAAALEGCGFRLTPFTAQTNQIDGKRVAAGTANRCAMLRQGYIEILAATEDTPLARQLQQRLVLHVGLHLAAFSSADAGGEHRRLADAGFPVQPLVDMYRPVSTDSGEQDAHFTIARIARGEMPEGRMQFLTHHTEHLVWRTGDLDHPNGAEALLALWIAAADLDEPARRFARFTGRPAVRNREITTIALDRGCLRFASPDHLHHRFGIASGPPLPYVAAYEISVSDLNRLGRCVASAGLALQATEGGVVLMLPQSVGGTIVFRSQTG